MTTVLQVPGAKVELTLRPAYIDIWCVPVNDAVVMGAGGREQKANGIVRMMGDGSAELTRAMGLEFDLSARSMGVRSQQTNFAFPA